MASVAGLVEQARGLIPEFVARRRRSPGRTDTRSNAVPALDPEPAPADPLTRVIVDLVVPKLKIVALPGDHVVQADVDYLVMIALDGDSEVLGGIVDTVVARGVPIDSILVELLAPAARQLGKLWEDDICDFVDVTMGLWRLQEIVREVSARAPARSHTHGGPSALFVSMPGETHNFGTVIIEDVFRRDGWATELLTDATTSEVLDAVARDHYDIVGLTVSCDASIAAAQALITALRSVSKNPALCLLLGGRVAMVDRDTISFVGADGGGCDAQTALEVAARLVTTSTCRKVLDA